GEIVELVGRADFRTLVEAVVRVRRIVPADTAPGWDEAQLTEPAERDLHDAVTRFETAATLTAFAKRGGELVAPIARFFDETLVMADDPEVRRARLGLLAGILDRAPSGIDWSSLDQAVSAG